MKRIIGLIILIIVLIPATVNADMGAPITEPYEMLVIAPDGIDCYDYNGKVNGHLDYNSKFKVKYEYDMDDNSGRVYYIETSEDDNTDRELKSLDGAVLITKELNPATIKSMNIEKTSGKALVYAKNGVDLLKGPAPVYDKIAHINNGTILNYTYTVGEDAVVYVYVNYNGKSGWVSILKRQVLLESEEPYIFRTDYTTSCGKILKGTIIKSSYTTDTWSGEHLFKYNGCEELIPTFRSDDVLIIGGSKETAYKSLKVYEYPEKEGKLITTIPANAEFNLYASSFSYGEYEDDGYVEYDGKRGWIHEKDDSYGSEKYEKVEFEYDFEEDEIPSKDKEQPTTGGEESEEQNEESTSKKPDDYVLTYVIIGTSVGLVAIIIIILANRNKKLKKQLKEAEQKEVIDNNEVINESVEQQNVENSTEEEKNNNEDNGLEILESYNQEEKNESDEE